MSEPTPLHFITELGEGRKTTLKGELIALREKSRGGHQRLLRNKRFIQRFRSKDTMAHLGTL